MLHLDKPHPAGTAGGKERKIRSVFKPVEEFFTFFYDGQVGADTRIVDFIKPEFSQGGADKAHGIVSGVYPEFLTDRDTDSRCHLGNNTCIFLAKDIPDFLGVVADDDCSGRTHGCALTAVHAVCLSDRAVECRHNLHFRAAECKIKDSHALFFRTGTHAITAQDTFVGVTDDCLA